MTYDALHVHKFCGSIEVIGLQINTDSLGISSETQ